MPRAAAVLLVPLALAAGCGSGGADADEDAREAAGPSVRLPETARYTVTLDVRSPGEVGGRVEAEGVGTADGTQTDVEGTFDVDGERSEALRFRARGDDVWEAGGDSLWVHAEDRAARVDELGLGIVTDALARAKGLREAGRTDLDGTPVRRLRGPGVEALVDPKGVVRRSRLVRRTDGGEEVLVHEVLEAGVRVDVRPPPQDDVIEQEDAGGQQG